MYLAHRLGPLCAVACAGAAQVHGRGRWRVGRDDTG